MITSNPARDAQEHVGEGEREVEYIESLEFVVPLLSSNWAWKMSSCFVRASGHLSLSDRFPDGCRCSSLTPQAA